MPEDPAFAIVRIEERLAHLTLQLSDLKAAATTREGTQLLIDAIGRLERALTDERLGRIEGDNGSKGQTEKVETRLQLVEDRMEQRKYLLGSGIALGVLGVFFGIFGDVISGSVFGA